MIAYFPIILFSSVNLCFVYFEAVLLIAYRFRNNIYLCLTLSSIRNISPSSFISWQVSWWLDVQGCLSYMTGDWQAVGQIPADCWLGHLGSLQHSPHPSPHSDLRASSTARGQTPKLKHFSSHYLVTFARIQFAKWSHRDNPAFKVDATFCWRTCRVTLQKGIYLGMEEFVAIFVIYHNT